MRHRAGVLLCEVYDWRGYILRRNVKVGRLKHGG